MTDLIRVYTLSDDYRCHVATDDTNEFAGAISAYLDLMQTSKKCNNYTISNCFMNTVEFNAMVSNMDHTEKTKKSNLKLLH